MFECVRSEEKSAAMYICKGSRSDGFMAVNLVHGLKAVCGPEAVRGRDRDSRQ